MTTYVSSNIPWGGTSSGAPSLATFISRWQAFVDALTNVGMVQTADTGQLVVANIASVTGNTTYGYQVWRFNDSLQGTDPLFVKFVFYTPSTANYQGVYIYTGTGSDGSGNLTGQVSNQSRMGGSFYGVSTTITASQVYACHVDGYFGYTFGPNNSSAPGYGYPFNTCSITRTRNVSGSFDGVGNIVLADTGPNDTEGQLVFTRTTSSPFSVGPTNQYCIVPDLRTSSALDNGDLQLYPHFYADPDIKQVWSQFCCVKLEFPAAPTTFPASPMYGEQRTFLGSAYMCAGEVNSGLYFTAMLWE